MPVPTPVEKIVEKIIDRPVEKVVYKDRPVPQVKKNYIFSIQNIFLSSRSIQFDKY